MLGAYPTILLLLSLLDPIIGQLPLYARAAVLVPLMVSILTYIVMPLLTRALAAWLVVNERTANTVVSRGEKNKLVPGSVTRSKAYFSRELLSRSKFFRDTARLLIGALTLSGIGCTGREKTKPVEPATPVTVAQPLRLPIVEWDEYTGRLEAIDSVEIRSRVGGHLQSTHFDEGHSNRPIMFVVGDCWSQAPWTRQ
jgi:hypothetical protein